MSGISSNRPTSARTTSDPSIAGNPPLQDSGQDDQQNQETPSTRVVQGKRQLPAQTSDNKVDASRPDHNRLEYADTLLETSSDARQVKSLAEPSPAEQPSAVGNSTPGPTNLDERKASPEQPPARSWFSYFNPLSWLPRKTTGDRTVSRMPQWADITRVTNWLLASLIKLGITRFTPSLDGNKLITTLQTLSRAYYQSPALRKQTPEVIHLDELVIPSAGLTLKDLDIRLQRVSLEEPDVNGNKRTRLVVVADINAKASYTANGESYEGSVSLPGIELEVDFKNGGLIKPLIQKGHLPGTMLSWPGLLMNPGDYVKPCDIKVKMKNSHLALHSPDSQKDIARINLNNCELKWSSGVFQEADGNQPGYQLNLRNFDASVASHRLEQIVPDSLKEILAKLVPYAIFSETELHLRTKALDLDSCGSTLRLDCPQIELATERPANPLAPYPNTLTGLQLVRQAGAGNKANTTVTAMGFQDAQSDLDINNATLALPWNLRGHTHLQNGRFELVETPATSEEAARVQLRGVVGKVDADIEGGLAFKGSAKNAELGFDSRDNVTTITSSRVEAQHFDTGTDPWGITDQTRLVSGNGRVTDLAVTVTPEPENDTITTKVNLDRFKLMNIDGITKVQKATGEGLAVTITNGKPMITELSVDIDHVDAKTMPLMRNNDLSEQTSALPLQLADLDQAEAKGVKLTTTLRHAPATQQEQDNFRAMAPGAINDWQVMKEKVVASETRMSVEQVEGDGIIKLSGYTPTSQYLAGAFDSGQTQIHLEHDADQGMHCAQFTSNSTGLNVFHGPVTGHARIQQLQGEFDQNHSGTSGLQLQAGQLAVKGLTADNDVMPEGIEGKADMAIENPVVTLELDQQLSSEAAAKKAAPQLKASVNATGSQLSTQLKIRPETVAVPTVREQMKLMVDYLPAQQQENFRALLEQAEAEPASRATTGTATTSADHISPPIEQTVALSTEALHGYAEKHSDTGLKTAIAIAQGTLTTRGALDAEAEVKDLSSAIQQQEGETRIDTRVDTLTIPQADLTETSPFLSTLHLNKPAKVHDLKLQTRNSAQETSLHASTSYTDVDLQCGIRGKIKDPKTGLRRDLIPAHITTTLKQGRVDIINSTAETLVTAQAGELDITADQLQEQIGADIRVSTAFDNALVSGHITNTSKRVDVQAGTADIRLSEELNGTIHLQDAGATVIHDQQGIRINTRLDSERSKVNFRNPVAEVLAICQKDLLKECALGQICNLEVTPRLDSSLSGTLSLSAKGALSPLLKLMMVMTGKRTTRAMIKIANLVTRKLDFGIRLDNLPIHQGTVKLHDFMECLKITISSQHGVLSRLTASGLQKIAALAIPWLASPVMRSTGLLDADHKEISLKHFIAQSKKQVTLVEQSQIPRAAVPTTTDPIANARTVLQLQHQLPADWTLETYRSSLKLRVDELRRNGLTVAELCSPLQRQQMVQTLMDKHPLPQTLEQFSALQQHLTEIQDDLRKPDQPLN